MHVTSTHRESGHGRYDAGLRGLRGHRGRGLTEGLGRFFMELEDGRQRLMGLEVPVSATSEAIEAKVLLRVWDVLHPRAVGEGG